MSTLNFTQFATFGDFAQFWLATKVDTKPTTQACYRSLLQCAAARFADMPITQIERADIMRWIVDLIEQREYDAGQVRAAHRVVHSTLALARCLGAIESNPATEITLPRIRNHSPRLDRRLAVPELESLAQQIGWWKLVPVHEVSLGLSGAFSRGESTRDTGLGEGGGTPFHEAPSGVAGAAPDGESSRDMRVAPREPRVVETFCGGETPRYTPGELRQVHVFRTRQNKPLRASNLRFHFALAAAAIGETGLHIHDLRHTAASLAVSAGANVKALAQMLGHSSAAMTLDVYADLFAEDLSDVADALDGLRRRQLR